jgi:hypothetical protein
VDYVQLQNVCDGIRQSQKLMDTPCSELNSQGFVDEAHKVIADLNCIEGLLASADVKGNNREGFNREAICFLIAHLFYFIYFFLTFF